MGGRTHRRLRAFVLGLVVVATALALVVPASAATNSTAWKAKLDKEVPAALKAADLPGAIVGVWQDGKLLYLKSFGVSDTKTGAPMKSDFHVRIGSLTKAFTVTAILQLAGEGKLALDDPIGKYIDGVPNGDRVTLRQLAEMRSGLGDYSADIIENLYKDPQHQFTTEELLERAKAAPIRFEPGAEFDYVNANTTLLGAVIEKVSGMSRAEYLKQYIAEPLGLKDTLVPDSSAIPKPHGRGYADWNPEQKREDATNWSPSWGNAAGDMISNMNDIAVFTRALGTGKLVTSDMRREREQALPADTEGVGARYGLAYELHPSGWQGHNGRIAGWTTYPYYLPERDLTIVLSLNTSTDVIEGWHLYQQIVETVTPDRPFSDPPSE
jgi:D-alanyl-D-alanine carboxypeptidase